MLSRTSGFVLAALALLLCGAFAPAAAHKSYHKHGTTPKLRCSPHKCPRAGRGGQPDPGPFAFAIIDNGNPPGDNTRFANSFTPDGVWTIPGADSLSSGPFVGPAEIEAAADRFSAAFADVKIEKLDAFYSAESGQKIVLELVYTLTLAGVSAENATQIQQTLDVFELDKHCKVTSLKQFADSSEINRVLCSEGIITSPCSG